MNRGTLIVCVAGLAAALGVAGVCAGGGVACQIESIYGQSDWRPVATCKAGRFWFNEKGESAPLQAIQAQGAVSPDGTHVAYLSSAGDGKQWGLYLAPVGKQTEGAAPAPHLAAAPVLLMQSEHMLSDLSWSPDGKWIAYTQAGDGWSVWKVGAGAGEPTIQRISEEGQSCRSPVYLPDGRLSFEKVVKSEGKVTLCDIVLVSGESRTTIVRAKHVFAHAWSPDGQRLAYSEPGSITILNVNDANAQPVTLRRAVGETHQNDAAHSISWRPDGAAIATAERFVGGRMVGTVIDSDQAVFVYSVMGGEPVMLRAPYEPTGVDWVTAATASVPPAPVAPPAPPATPEGGAQIQEQLPPDPVIEPRGC